MPPRQAVLIAAAVAFLGLLVAALVLLRQSPSPEPAGGPALLAELRAIRELLERREEQPAGRSLPRPPDDPSLPRAEPLQPAADAALREVLAELTAAVRALSAGAAGVADAPGVAPSAPEQFATRLAELAAQLDEDEERTAPAGFFLGSPRHVIATLGPPRETWEVSNGNAIWTWFLDAEGDRQVSLEFAGGHCVRAFRRR